MLTEFEKVPNLLSASNILSKTKSTIISSTNIELEFPKFTVKIEASDENWNKLFGLVKLTEIRDDKTKYLGLQSAEGCLAMIEKLLSK